MITTLIVVWLSANSENLNPELLYVGTVWIDLNAWDAIGAL